MGNSHEKTETMVYEIKPSSCPFITGIAPSYSEEYDKEALEKHLSKQEFKGLISRINSVLFRSWP